MEKIEIDSALYEVNWLMREKNYTNCKIEYILINRYNSKDAIAVMRKTDFGLYQVSLKDREIMKLEEWFYNIDEDIFDYLEKEYELGFMTLEFHNYIWNEVERVGVEEYEHQMGFQKYLKFCKNNGVSKKRIRKESDINVMNIMQYYDKKMDFIEIENGQVKMPIAQYQNVKEISYISFVLLYDNILNGKLNRLYEKDCDKTYEFCKYLADDFIKSKEHNNRWQYTYDNLKDWVAANEDAIISKYLYFFNIDKDNKENKEKKQKNKNKERER